MSTDRRVLKAKRRVISVLRFNFMFKDKSLKKFRHFQSFETIFWKIMIHVFVTFYEEFVRDALKKKNQNLGLCPNRGGGVMAETQLT